MSPPLQFRITPLDLARHRESLPALEARFTNFTAALAYPVRLISVVRRFSFAPVRAALQHQAARLERDYHLPPEDEATGGAGYGWRWRFYKHYRRMWETLETVDPPLAVTHYLVAWPPPATNSEAVRATLQSAFLLPAVVAEPLPALIPGRYREEATYLQPVAAGYPFLCVLTAWDVRGAWDLQSWLPLLMGDDELALAIDVQTLRRDQALRRTTDAFTLLQQAVYGRHAVKDARSERALAATNHTLQALGEQALHEVAVAVLVQAPTRARLEAAVQRITTALGVQLRLDRMVGAQAAYARLFTPLPASQVQLPLVRRNTLSHGVAVKVPWGIRKTARTEGVLFGYDPQEGMPILFEIMGASGAENAHLLMIGKAGSGKTVTLLTLALREAVAGAQVVFFDPIGKCRLLCEAVGTSPRGGAAFYTVERDATINILDPVTTELHRQRSSVERKLGMILGRTESQGGQVRLIPRALTNFELGALDLALQQPALYGPAGDSLPAMLQGARRPPLLADLAQALDDVAQQEEEPAAAALAREIRLLLLGSRARLFNRPTTLRWDFGADVSGYSFRGADPSLLPLYYDHAFEALNRYVRTRSADAPPLIAVIDEYYFMASVRELEAHVALATKTWRNFRAAMWTADQNATTYFGAAGLPSQWGQFTANNALIKLIFRQEASEADIVGRAYHDQLAPEHIHQIKTAGTGECVALFGDEVHSLLFHMTDQERRYFAA